MKKLFVVFLLCAGVYSSGNAQSFSLGATLGANLSKINSTSFNTAFKAGYLAGAYAQLRFGKHWGIQPELLFVQSQTTTDSNFNELYGSQLTNAHNLTHLNLNYLDIPVLLTYRILGIIDLQAGPQFGVLLNKNNSLLENGQNAFKTGAFTLLTGAEVHILRLRAYARYGWALGDINNMNTAKLTSSDTWKQQCIQLGVGINIL